MRTLIIITILLSGCKFETKEQKLERMRKNSCDLAHRYISECAYEHKGARVAPLVGCTQEDADKILSMSCVDLLLSRLQRI
jgi:hypothetical protein